MHTKHLSLFIVLFFISPLFAQQKDVQGCKDHPLFTRMPTYWIHNCDEKEFNSFAFRVDKGKTEPVEGHFWRISYYPQATTTTKPSDLQILRNFESAATKLGGTVIYAEKGRETLRLSRDGKDIWVEVSAEFTGKYGLTIVEREAMKQDIEANAGALLNDIKTTGHAAVYGIHFDTGKSDLKPESHQALGEIAKLLAMDSALKLYVVGHTDNVGGLGANMKLSQDRAGAVLQALVRDHGIAATRLKSFGAGPYAPVSTNDTEDGRVKNRRVELVKQ
jgi:OOP family OmpA-OmpF porin